MNQEDLGIRGLLAGYRSGARVPEAVLRAAHARAEQYPQPVWITLLDWDTVALAPPERDLWALAQVDPAIPDAYAAATGRVVEPGMLEFYADPTSPYHRPEFDPERRVILHCASGGRSALAAATLQQMGYRNVAHLDGGLRAWKEQGHPTEG